MKLSNIVNIINYSFKYVIQTSQMYNIDESHSLRHSMDVFHFAKEIYQDEIYKSPFLKEDQNIIFASAILHDMCDKKYMNEQEGIQKIEKYMTPLLTKKELDITKKIISTMSYSTVSKNGYPDLGLHNLAYHIVRESDLLSAYDVERCFIYQMIHENYNYDESFRKVKELFDSRVLKYREKNLFLTDYSKKKSEELHANCLMKLAEFEKRSNIQL